MATFDLTLSELRQIQQAGGDVRQAVDSLNDQPEWLLAMGGINDLAELKAIYQGGCASGAFMPAVTYHTANNIMCDFGDDVIEYLDSESCHDFALNPAEDSWSGFASKLLSCAVESWVYTVINTLNLNEIEAS